MIFSYLFKHLKSSTNPCHSFLSELSKSAWDKTLSSKFTFSKTFSRTYQDSKLLVSFLMNQFLKWKGYRIKKIQSLFDMKSTLFILLNFTWWKRNTCTRDKPLENEQKFPRLHALDLNLFGLIFASSIFESFHFISFMDPRTASQCWCFFIL